MRKCQGSNYTVIGILIIIILIVVYSYIKTGNFIDGINQLLSYIQEDPIAAGILLISGIILGKLVFRSSGFGGF